MNPFPPVSELVPHRPPMLLLVRVLHYGGADIECQARLPRSGPMVAAHRVGVLWALELVAQACAAWSGLASGGGEPVTAGYVIASPRFEFATSELPREVALVVRATHVGGDTAVSSFAGSVSFGDRRLAHGTLTVIKALAHER